MHVEPNLTKGALYEKFVSYDDAGSKHMDTISLCFSVR